MKRMFGTAQVIWATLMLALFDAVGVLVPAPRPPKVFRPGRVVRNVIFFALLVMALLLSYSFIIEQSAFMAITAIGSAATWATPLQIAHGVVAIRSAGERSINQVMDHACKAVFVKSKSRFDYKRAGIMPSPASGHVPLLSMTKTSMMAKINDQNRSEALFMCMHMNFDDHGQSRIAMLDSGCNNIMMPLDGEINAKVVDFDRNGGITGEGVKQSFTTEASGTLGITVPGTAPEGSHFKFDMLADGVQFFPAATSIMSQTLFPITWFLRAGCDAIFTGRSSLKDKMSGHGEISLYELTENSKDYKGTLALNCWNDLWFFKYSIFSPARHDAASAIAMSASIQKQSATAKAHVLAGHASGRRVHGWKMQEGKGNEVLADLHCSCTICTESKTEAKTEAPSLRKF